MSSFARDDFHASLRTVLLEVRIQLVRRKQAMGTASDRAHLDPDGLPLVSSERDAALTVMVDQHLWAIAILWDGGAFDD